MGWLQKLLSLETPENASLQSAAADLRGPFPWWAAALLVAVAGAGVFFLYFRERGRIGVARRSLMAVLRIAAIGLLALLLLRPVLVAEYRGERPRGVTLLIDNTLSMRQRDKRLSAPDRLRVAIAENLLPPRTSVTSTASPGSIPPKTSRDPERAHLVRAVLSNPRLHLLDGLRRPGSLRTYLFGQRLRGIEDRPDEDLLDAFKANESRTALADAIKELLLRKEGDLPSAVVIMTDGRDNASKMPLDEVAEECARLKVPLHIYGVGSTEGGTLQLKDMAVADTLFYEDAVSVPVRWRCHGLKRGTVAITLTMNGQAVPLVDAQGREQPAREVEVREGEDLRTVLTFVPHKGSAPEERVDLVAAIRLKGNDAFRDDLKRPVRIIDRRVKVLYIENSPRWEYKFLQAALLRDHRVEPRFLLVNGDPDVLKGGEPFLPAFPARDQLFAYDLLILGDVAATYLGTEHMEWIRDFVNEGGGLVVIAGRQHAPAGYVDTSLAEVLPVEVLPVRFEPGSDARPQPFVPVLTDAGKRHDMLALADTEEENLRTWKELPGIYWQYPVVKLRAGARSLLDHPQLRLKAGDKPMPLLASQYYGKGESLFLATDETWRWRYNAGDHYFARFWGQVIYQVGLPHLLGNARRAQLALERSDVVLGRPCSVYAHLFDKDFRAFKAEHVFARLEFLDARSGDQASRDVRLEAVPGQAGEFRALLANEVPGRFELKLEGDEPASLQYRVALPPQHELEPVGMAEDALREAARASGGRFYREEDLHRLADDIEPRKVAFTQRQEVLLWNPLALALFVCLVTAEWTLRKFSNLS
ncbi:MAG TPA: hypothetical protein VG013_22815 [Gemmataceae bacterium]|jgi:hypothetical protein|nr:hypothetical protein [Gemmataceae bacterium]